MWNCMKNFRCHCLLLAGMTAAVVSLLSLSPSATAAEKVVKSRPAATKTTKNPAVKRRAHGAFHEGDEIVDFFAAKDAGQLEVQFIPKDDTVATVFIKNKTDKPLNVKLPEAFAGVPVLAQMGGMGGGGGGMGGGGMGGGGGGGGSQGMGGGMGGGGGGGGMGGGGMGGGGGMMNIMPEKEFKNPAKIKVACVCLEHGKPNPKASIKYDIVPVEQFTDRVAVHEVLKMLGNGEIDRRAAQAAVWHLNNDMSWDELYAKEIKRLGGVHYSYFSDEEMRNAIGIANAASSIADEAAKSKTGSEKQDSTNSPGDKLQSAAAATSPTQKPVKGKKVRRNAKS